MRYAQGDIFMLPAPFRFFMRHKHYQAKLSGSFRFR